MRATRKPLAALLVAALVVGCLPSKKGRVQTLTGRIYVTGNEPFTQLAIEIDDQRVYRIAKQSPSYDALWKLQGRQVRVRYKPGSKTQPDVIFVIGYKEIRL